MITAFDAKQIQIEYLDSQYDIDLYMKDVEEAIKDGASEGVGSIVFSFKSYNLKANVMKRAKDMVRKELVQYGYQVINGDPPFEILIFWQ